MHSSSLFTTALALTLLGLTGCSGGETDAAPDTTKPLAGKSPTKASQFEGRWVGVGQAEFDSMEFMDSGQAIVGGADAGLTVSYTVLEGGRLSLSLEGGMTTVYDAKVTSDQLELSSKGNLFSDAGTFRYRRLGKGETVDGVLRKQALAKAEAFRKRTEALQAFLQQKDLVLAFTESGASAPASIALDIRSDSGSFSGKAWHDDRPPHQNAISGELQIDDSAGVAQVEITYGPRIAPPTTQPDGGGRIVLAVDGPSTDLRISANVTLGGSGPAHELVLRNDKELHAAIVGRFEAELARIEALKKPMVALLGDYAVLRGRLQPMDARYTPDTTELTLVRDSASGQYWCEGTYLGQRGRGEAVASAAAEIAVVRDRPVLRIVTPPAREYHLELGGPAGLSGQWMPTGRDQGYGAQFEVALALDAKARDAMFEVRRKVLKSLPPDAVFTGLAFEDSATGMEMPVACRLQLTVGPDGAVVGKADYPTLATVMSMGGRLEESKFGPRLELRYTAADSTPGDQIFLRSIQNGSWRLVPEDDAAGLRLTGYFNGPPLRPATFTLVDEESTSRLRERLVEVMGHGSRFHVARFVGWQQPGIVPTVVELELDAASGRVTGQMVVDGRALGTNDKLATTYEGKVEERSGWLSLELMQAARYRPTERMVAALDLFAGEDTDGVLHLNGAIVGLGTLPEATPTPEFPKSFDRRIDLIPVDATDAEMRATIDQAIADVAQAKADAEAAAVAAAAAATDSRRAKLAPFFPMFRAEGGLVVTTDASAKLGAAILEVAVDEEQASITGTGVDLREMPFREFTFQCGVDNWSNLTLDTSIGGTHYAFAAPKEEGVAAGKYMKLSTLSPSERGELDALIAKGKRLQTSPPATLDVEILDAATAKAREASLGASSMPGIALYKGVKNDKVAAMFTAQSNGRYRWAKEAVLHRLDEPMRGKALYFKSSGPTSDLVVVINGVHRARIPAVAAFGAAVVTLPPDLEIMDLRLEAEGTAQARGVVLLEQ